MANNNSPFGFIPVKSMGGEGSPVINRYAIASGHGTAIGLGDPVKFAGDCDAFGSPLITLAGASDVYVGVFAGVEWTPANGDSPVFSKNWPASTTPLTGSRIVAHVYDDPRTLYKVQVSGALTTSDIPNNAQLTAGSIVNGISGAMLDSGTYATTNTHGWRIRELFQAPDNELGTYGIVIAQINRSAFANQIATGT